MTAGPCAAEQPRVPPTCRKFAAAWQAPVWRAPISVSTASTRHPQRPFGYYQIIRAADELAVGGAGFKDHQMTEPLKLATA